MFSLDSNSNIGLQIKVLFTHSNFKLKITTCKSYKKEHKILIIHNCIPTTEVITLQKIIAMSILRYPKP